MGLYLEPQIDRRLWLVQNGELVTRGHGRSKIDYKEDIPKDKVLVCLIDNGHFQAAGVAYDEREFKAFDNPDGRMKRWYLVDTETAKAVAPQWDIYFNRH
jgi:hypothetical protein